MKRRMLAVLLALCLFVGLLPTFIGTLSKASAATATLENSVNMDQLVEHGISMFKALEAGGKWDNVANQPSTGCVGLGIMGWINSSALQVLKWCATSSKGGDPAYCKSVLGETFYNEIVNAPVVDSNELMPRWGYWGSRKFSTTEIANTKRLLGSDLGIRVQKNLANLYITRQAQHGWAAGVRTEAALLYYCSAENHYGVGGIVKFMNAVRNAMGISSSDTINSLREFHNGVVTAAKTSSTVNSTLEYRKKVYNYLVNTLCLSQDPNPGGTIPFTDMPGPNHWAYDAIIWAYTANPQIAAGTSNTTFSPDATVTRADAVSFLWRAAGKPEPKTKTNPFSDVSSDKYYYKPVLWAVEKGITYGTTDTTFSPKDKVKREHMITFLWRYAGKPSPGGSASNPFTDISSDKYYYTAAVWAYYGGILIGNECPNDPHRLDPKADCSRAYVVTYLYNQFIMTAH